VKAVPFAKVEAPQTTSDVFLSMSRLGIRNVSAKAAALDERRKKAAKRVGQRDFVLIAIEVLELLAFESGLLRGWRSRAQRVNSRAIVKPATNCTGLSKL
jgi:hypothetical protein